MFSTWTKIQFPSTSANFKVLSMDSYEIEFTMYRAIALKLKFVKKVHLSIKLANYPMTELNIDDGDFETDRSMHRIYNKHPQSVCVKTIYFFVN